MILIRSQQNNTNTTLRLPHYDNRHWVRMTPTSRQWALTIGSISLTFNSVPLKEGLY